MNVLTTEDFEIDAPETHDRPDCETPPSSIHMQRTQPALTEQQEAFLRDRFTTKLEDPQTGRWIRSWRAEGTTP